MLLESIKLNNFRQFIDTTIEFSQSEKGNEKNVTMIIGDNGSGKTTLAQGFLWCLYGETDFSDKVLLNKKKVATMKPSDEETVLVELRLKHGNNRYIISREQTYKKEYGNKLSSQKVKFDVGKIEDSGQTIWENRLYCESIVESILPKALSKYFFFDGERIEKMSKDISSSKKSEDFAKAVKGLLGLDAMDSAIKHFNPNSKYGVIGSYNESFDDKNNEMLRKCNEDYKIHSERLEKINSRLEELETQIENATLCKNSDEHELKKYDQAKHFQLQREEKEKYIEATEQSIANNYKTICTIFNNNIQGFISLSLIDRCLELLKDKSLTDKDIPSINADTINYLLKKGICLCGGELKEGTEEYNNVKEWLKYLPPCSISTSINEFKNKVKTVLNRDTDLKEEIREQMGIIIACQDKILETTSELQVIDEKLGGEDVQERVRTLNKTIQALGKQIISFNAETRTKIGEKGREEALLETIEKKRRELAFGDKKNRSIEMYKICAEQIYNELQTAYKTSEEKIRLQLKDNINRIFQDIYKGGLYLNIDEKYHISISESNYDGDVEASTGQNVSAIFAFITAIIKMARDNRTSNDDNAKLLSSEPYPLVMDAPLSSFDKKRIESGCKAIPKIADQVVIFIKNTDGDLAEKYMGDRIGKKYTLTKTDELESILEKVK